MNWKLIGISILKALGFLACIVVTGLIVFGVVVFTSTHTMPGFIGLFVLIVGGFSYGFYIDDKDKQ